MALPTIKLEVAWTNNPFDPAPTWVDESANLLSISTKRGRQYELNQNDTGTATIVVDNSDGRYTPERTSSALYPNVLIDRQVRISATWASVTYPLWQGFITSYTPTTDAMTLAYSEMQFGCVDAFAFLGFGNIDDAFVAEATQDKAISIYTMADDQASTQAGDSSGNSASSLTAVTVGAGSYAFGTETLAANGQTGFQVTSPSSASGAYLVAFNQPAAMIVSLCVQMNVPSARYADFPTIYVDRNVNILLGLTGTLFVVSTADGNNGSEFVSSSINVNDNQPHQITTSIIGTTLSLFVDGVLQGTSPFPATFQSTGNSIVAVGAGLAPGLGATVNGTRTEQGIALGTAFNPALTVWNLARFSSSATLSDTIANRAAAWYQGFKLYAGESEVSRIARYARYSGLGLSTNMGTALSTMAADNGQGQTYLAGIQATAESVNGDVIIAPNGQLKYTNRQARYNASAQATFADSAGNGIETTLPAYDDQLIVDQVNITRTTGSVQVIQNVTVPMHPQSVTLNVSSDLEATDFGNWLLGLYSTPHTRCDSVTINPTAQSASTMWTQTLARVIQDCITLSDLPAQFPASSLSFFIESIQINVNADGATPTWVFTFGLSPQSFMPTVLTLDDAVYGKLDSNHLGY